MTVWQQIKVHAKAIGVFLFGVFGPPLLKILMGEAPLPQTRQEWINWAFAAAGSAVVALLARNKITQDQLDKDPGVAPGAVVVPESPTNVVEAKKSDIDDVPPPTPGLGGSSWV